MAAPSTWGETTTMRENAPGSTSPHVGSAHVVAAASVSSGTVGSYGHVARVPGEVVAEGRQQRADDGGARDAGQPARDDGELDAGEVRHQTGLEVAQARAALDDGHLDRRHAAAEA